MFFDFSIDLETLGNQPYSVVLSIGIVAFNRNTGEMDEGFYTNIDPVSATGVGLRMNPDTVMWWMKQSDEARAAFSSAGPSIQFALSALNTYFKSHDFGKSHRVWGNGSGFDVNLLEDAYSLARVPCPWQFWQARDVRTIVDLAQLDKKAYRAEGVHHNALDDAINQARMVIDGCSQLLAVKGDQ